ncbi:unnamed protein product [Musa acuminata subsp. malaccensis]|uniref:(wild Malaysian banana) hypothetical protein n=1 Tax=Musa acuminata subsp. malaccensis TaxID=214687 RepID=A0A804JMM3_MUSAM|nr:unnamed protein product [Musa acuminata subsp. malaccensis]
MGCLFRCFRPEGSNGRRRDRPVPRSRPSTSKINQGSLVSKRQLESFFVNEDHGSLSKQVSKSSAKDNVHKDGSYGELKHETDFLKASGALLRTPEEIQKASRIETAQAPAKEGLSSNHVSKLPGASCKELLCDENYKVSRCPSQEQENAGISQSNTECFTFKGHQTPQCCEYSLPSVNQNFESVQNEYTVEPKLDGHTADILPSQHEPCNQPFASKNLPFPTPVEVTDEMETSATVYPTNLGNTKYEKNTRIGTQYIFPILNPVENLSRQKLLNEDSSEPLQSYDSSDHKTNNIPDAGEKIQQISLVTDPEEAELSGTPRYTSPSRLETPRDKTLLRPEYPDLVTTSLSQWLKPPIAKDEHNEIKEKSHSGKSSYEDRPILGMVAAHWKEEEPGHKSPKEWDGNGIPNSTNKYKEDQKVSWHATPFEERLEKALSDENSLPKRKFVPGKRVEFEDELSDTAAS